LIDKVAIELNFDLALLNRKLKVSFVANASLNWRILNKGQVFLKLST
jgi:hypothetical protein